LFIIAKKYITLTKV